MSLRQALVLALILSAAAAVTSALLRSPDSGDSSAPNVRLETNSSTARAEPTIDIEHGSPGGRW